VLQLTGFGTPGPWQEFPAYGPAVEALGGINAMMGEPGEPPQRIGSSVFADTLAGRYAALALCAALLRRDVTGRGEYIDLSMYECVVSVVGDAVARAARTGTAPPRLNNRSESAAPEGIYPAEGVDEWVAITVADDAQWAALRGLIGDPALDDRSYDGLDGRRRGHDAIDAVISRWTRARSKVEAAESLQEAGVAAGPVQKPRDLPVDPQYDAGGFFQMVRHRQPILGYSSHPHMRLPARFVGHARANLTDHQPEGSAAERILRSWLSATDDRIRQLRGANAFGDARAVIPAGTPRPWWFGARDAHHDPDYAERLGLIPDEAGS
jgi:crotonobetainyl-CoA:carnitine CoA-transferase CaiB-like acyl-CoA transferase